MIRKVENHTGWGAGMVVVAKTKGVSDEGGLVKLSESVQREKHDLPLIDQTLWAKVFTKYTTSAPEYIQKMMNIMLDGLPCVLDMMDDIIIFGDSRQEVKAVLKRSGRKWRDIELWKV